MHEVDITKVPTVDSLDNILGIYSGALRQSQNPTQDMLGKLNNIESTNQKINKDISTLQENVEKICAGNYTCDFIENDQLKNISANDTLAVILGKIQKLYASLGSAAFLGVSDNLEVTENNVSLLDAKQGNVIKTDIGDLSLLNTEDKTSLVNSINELKEEVADVKSRLDTQNIKYKIVTKTASQSNANYVHVNSTYGYRVNYGGIQSFSGYPQEIAELLAVIPMGSHISDSSYAFPVCVNEDLSKDIWGVVQALNVDITCVCLIVYK